MFKIEGSASVDEPMAEHSSFRIGGPADLYVVPADADEAARVLGICARESVPVFLLGGGTNILVADRGIRGVVVDLSRVTGTRADGHAGRCRGRHTRLRRCRVRTRSGPRRDGVLLLAPRQRGRRGLDERTLLRERDRRRPRARGLPRRGAPAAALQRAPRGLELQALAVPGRTACHPVCRVPACARATGRRCGH